MHLTRNLFGKDKEESRWEQSGIFVRLSHGSAEIIVMSREGVIKVRAFDRKTDFEK